MAVRRPPDIENGVHLHPALCGRGILRPARLPLGRDSDNQRRWGTQCGALRAGLLPLPRGLLQLRPLPAFHGNVQVRNYAPFMANSSTKEETKIRSDIIKLFSN